MKPTLTLVLAVAAAATALWLARHEPGGLAAFGTVAGALWGLARSPGWSRRARVSFATVLTLAALGFAFVLVEEARENLGDPSEWDFLGFWLYAGIARDGGDFYDGESAVASAQGQDTSGAFRREVLETGFWYPPPSMFLFYPLAWLPLGPALATWYAAMLVAAAACVALCARMFLPERGWIGIAAAALVLLSSRAALSNVHFAQTTFFGLVLMLLFWRDRLKAAGGGWIALAFFVKPFFAALGLPLLARGRFKSIACGLAAGLVLAGAALLAFGAPVFLDYFTGDGASPRPEWIYRENTNQSLLGLALRLTGARCAGLDCLSFPAYALPALLVAAWTIPLAWRLTRPADEWSIALSLLAALLVYPVSQPFYAVALAPVLLLIWRDRERVGLSVPAAAILAGAIQTLGWLDEGKLTVAAVGAAWLATGWLGWRIARHAV